MLLEKAKSSARLKTSDFERARKDLTAALSQFNLYQSDHYNRTLPVWAHTGYQLEQDRHTRTQTLFNVLYERVRVAADRLNTVCTDLQSVSTGLGLERDVEQLIARLRSGTSPPGDLTFEDLTAIHTAFGDAADSSSDKSSIGAIYASGSAVLPSNFCNSNSAADYGGSESSGFVDPAAGGPIYAGTGSVYSAYSVSKFTSGSRRPSASAVSGSTSPAGHGTALLRRFFSRRSRHDLSHLSFDHGSQDGPAPDNSGFRHSERKTKRGLRSLRRKSTSRNLEAVGQIRSAQSTGNLSVANVKRIPSTAGEADYRQNGLMGNTQRHVYTLVHQPTNGDRDLLDSSDFSDTSFDSDVDAPRSRPEDNAYAATSVLVGLNSAAVSSASLENQRSTEFNPTDTGTNFAAPLAESESLSIAPPTACGTKFSDSNSVRSPADIRSLGIPTDYMNPLHSKIRNGGGTASMEPDGIIATRSSPITTNKEICQTESVPVGANCKTSNDSASQNTSCATRSRLPVRPPPLAFGKKPLLADESHTHRSNTTSDVSDSGSPVTKVASVSVSNEPTQLSVNDRRQTINRKHHFPHNPPSRTNFGQDTAIVVGTCTALYPFTADGFESCYLPFNEGEKFYALAPSPTEDTSDWLRVLRFRTYESGYVPTAYVEQQHYTQPVILPIGAHTDEEPSSQTSNRTIRVNSRLSQSPTSCNRVAKGPRMPAPGCRRIPGATRDTEL
ncbi:hypothetical protein D915_008706 [Fasciola hepatica]|uniref:SH3 domain-containing protein n=1 Tax=Fasciola hepatica TaxID=6192 RepID=A0A4E0RFZ7_FASHE|nr:hypothetical protein D915_008706 [Fasciola hepatica]